MKSMSPTLLAGLVAATPSPVYLTQLADTFIETGVQPPSIDYQQATLYLGFEKAYELSGNKKYLDWYKSQIDGHVVQDDGTIKDWDDDKYSLDDYRMGNNYLYLYDRTGDLKYKSAANIVRRHIDSHPRTPSGGFWHQAPAFANQMWLDGIFMADSFYAKWTNLFDPTNTTAWDDIFLQYNISYYHTYNKTSGLLVHGWAETDTAPWADPVTGRAPHVWGRAVGWYFMSLVEVLQEEVSGGWWQVMDDPYPSEEGNYIESSGSAMFTYGLLKGIDLGFLERRKFLSAARRAYHSLVDNFIQHQQNGTLHFTGTVGACGLSSANATFEYYISIPTGSNDYKGSGPYMLAAYEWETWAKHGKS